MRQTGYPSIDKPWLKYYSEEAINAPLPEGSMYEYMMSRNRENLSDTAINYFGRKITYGQLDKEIGACAEALAGMGIGQGDVVSLNMLAMPEMVYLLYAVNRLGAVSNLVVLSGTTEEIGKQILSAGSKVVITVDLAAEKVLEALEERENRIPVIVVELSRSMPFGMPIFAPKSRPKRNGWIKWSDFFNGKKEVPCRYPRINSKDTAIIAYTSGTTGESKGVLISNRAANALAFQYIQANKIFDFNRRETFLNIIPPFLSYGLFVALHMPLCGRMEVILSPDSDPKHFARNLLKYKPNHFSGGPMHINNMLSDCRVDKTNLSFIITASYGGDDVNAEQEQTVTDFLHRHGCKYGLIKGYGLTEMASTFGTKGHHTEAMIPFMRNNIKVLDLDSGEELTYGQEGEICVSGPSMMDGYMNREEETAEIIWEENGIRWMHTGDLGYVSEEGYFYITGRIKRILWAVEPNGIVSRVYPMKIEAAINTHEKVENCAVVGMPNGEKGYLTKAYVVCVGAGSERLKEEIFEICRKHLAPSSWPAAIEFIQKLPTTSAGKVDYRSLEKMAKSCN